jgi:hypothetical protein
LNNFLFGKKMRRSLILLVCAFATAISFAQTEKAKAMYAEATGGKVSVEEYMKQDFSIALGVKQKEHCLNLLAIYMVKEIRESLVRVIY